MRRRKRSSSASRAIDAERERIAAASRRPGAPIDSLAALRVLYARVDAVLDGWGCDASTDCCRFGVTGREPYPTAVELAELERALLARGGLPKRRTLAIVDERRCALLGDDGRCVVYRSRPFGCRTFFCERARDTVGQRADEALPRHAIAAFGREIVELSARFAPGDPGPRPLSRATRAWEPKRGR